MSVNDLVRQLVAGRDDEFAATAGEVAAIVAGLAPEWSAAMKWGQLTFAERQDCHHWLCGVKVTKRAVVLTFHFGGLFDDPHGRLIAGSSQYLRRLEYQSRADIDETELAGFVGQASALLPRFREEQAR